MQHRFFALISRMRYICRWGLMRNTFEENVQEHSHMVAVLAHGLAMIQRDILGQPADPDRCAAAALFHDASEILTGDLPTPIKYYKPQIRSAYKQVERFSCEKLLEMLPPQLKDSYAPLLFESDPATAAIVKAADNADGYEHLDFAPGHPKTAIQWFVTPGALYWGPKFLYERYKVPFMITENGMSCHDAVSLDGKVHDPNRQDYMHRYLREFKRAAEDGVDAIGYFAWSLMDNFEWAFGYFDRFGLVYVDYNTQERIVKDSFYWYKEVMETNGENL